MAADLFEVKCVMRTSSNGSPWSLVSGGPDIIKNIKSAFTGLVERRKFVVPICLQGGGVNGR